MTVEEENENLVALIERVRRTRADVRARPDKRGRHLEAMNAEAALGAWLFDNVERVNQPTLDHPEGPLSERDIREIATDLLICAVAWDPVARLVGNVRALEIAAFCKGFLQSLTKDDDTCATCRGRFPDAIGCATCRGTGKKTR
jgi:hypothetical protein